MKKLVCLMLVFLMASVFVACSPAEDPSGERELVLGFNSEPSSLVPTSTASLADVFIIQNMFDGLVRLNKDTSQVEPLLAEEWQISEDGLTMTFKIKEDVKFHNGDIMTVDDVVGSLKLAKESPVTQDVLALVETITAGEGNTVVMTFTSEPNNMFLHNLATGGKFGILNINLYEDVGLSGYQDNPVGTGPYKFEAWNKGSNIKMSAFEDYHLGAASIKDITFRIIVDSSTTTMALEAGQVHLSGNVALAELDAVDMTDLNLYQGPGDSLTYLFMNTQNQYLSDPRVRKAITMLANRDEILSVIANDLGVVAKNVYRDGTIGYDETITTYDYNVEAARNLLKEAGYENGFKLNFKTNEGSGPAIGEMLQNNLKAVGIDIEIDVMETNAYLQDCFAGNFDIGYMIYNPGHLQPLLADRILNSASPVNLGRFISEELDSYLHIAMYEKDADAVAAVVPKIQEIIKENAPIIPLFWQDVVVLAHKDLKGLTNISINYPYYLSW